MENIVITNLPEGLSGEQIRAFSLQLAAQHNVMSHDIIEVAMKYERYIVEGAQMKEQSPS